MASPSSAASAASAPSVALDPDVERLASELRLGVGLLLRRLRAVDLVDGELTMPEASVLAALDRIGPATAAALAKREQISPQSMGVTVAALTERGLLSRERDPGDGRRIRLTVTRAGAAALHERRSARTQRLAAAIQAELGVAERRAVADVVALIVRIADAL